MGHAGITVTADTYADEQFDKHRPASDSLVDLPSDGNQVVRPQPGPIEGPHGRLAGATFTR